MSLASNGSLVIALLSGEKRTIWSSEDGYHWQLETTLDPDAYPQMAVAAPDGFLVVGGSGESSLGYWTSPDGHAWSQADLGDWASTMLGAAVGPDGTRVFLTGCTAPKPAAGDSLCGGVVKDGAWTTIDDPDFDGGVFGAVAAGPDGFLAVGQDRTTDFSPGAVWASADGLAWEESTDAAMANFIPWGAGAVSDGWVVVGSLVTASGFAPAALHSADGRTWTDLSDASAAISAIPSQDTTGALGMLGDVVQLGDGTLALVGVTYVMSGSSQEPRALLLRSAPDGSWTVVPEVFSPAEDGICVGGCELRTAEIVGSRIVVGGSDQAGPLVWVGEPAS